MKAELTALVVGKFAPFHKGHQLVIDKALETLANVIVLLYSNPDFEIMPSAIRANWIKEIYHERSVQVFTPTNPPLNSADDFVQRKFVKDWLERELAEVQIDKVFGSEDYIAGFADYLGVPYELVDLGRKQQAISGTALRRALNQLNEPASYEVLKSYLHPIVLQSLLEVKNGVVQ